MPSLVMWNLQKKTVAPWSTVLIKMKPALLTCHRFGRIWIYCWWYEVTNHISLSANVPAGPDKNWSPLPWRTPTHIHYTVFGTVVANKKHTLGNWLWNVASWQIWNFMVCFISFSEQKLQGKKAIELPLKTFAISQTGVGALHCRTIYKGIVNF